VAVYFVDSSALVKRYVQERGTAWVVSLLDPTVGHAIYVARIAGAEVVAAIARRRRSGELSSDGAEEALRQFRREFTSAYHIVEITPALVERAMALAETCALRGYDTVQLAAALEVNAACLSLGMSPLTLVSADGELNAAAMAEGLPVENPNAY
jgi:uncharacterized protein